jgi:hypothetical protein
MKYLKQGICAAGLALVAMQASAQVSANASAAGVLNLQESIVNNGDGTWTYNYSLTNLTEANNAWWVVLYTNLSPLGATALGDGSHTGWSYYYGGVPGDITAPSGQANVVYTYAASDGWPTSSPNGVGMGQTVGGFSFTAGAYDASGKAFYVDVVPNWGGSNLGHNGNGSQIFNYGGVTAAVPEPETYLMMGIGLVALAGLRRRAINASRT